MLDELFWIQGRKKWDETIDEMQKDFHTYFVVYNTIWPTRAAS